MTAPDLARILGLPTVYSRVNAAELDEWNWRQEAARKAYAEAPFALADLLTHCGRCRASLHHQCTGWTKDPIRHVEVACECVDSEHVEDMVPVGHPVSDAEWEANRHDTRDTVTRAVEGEHVHLTIRQRAEAVSRLHAQGYFDGQIAGRLNLHRRTVLEIRHRLNLPPNYIPGRTIS